MKREDRHVNGSTRIPFLVLTCGRRSSRFDFTGPFSSLFETLCKLLADVLHLMDSFICQKRLSLVIITSSPET